ncbi:Glycerol dehydrogenase-related enzyme [Rubrobacter radiotolerans]|uniref:Glycerol dehydrogenase n=1 Tax=Rubrobacter radiotolerans TaxID=42256 RepID=A0A023X496_RUBRA|nr:glycerol dehydrogenase [Rubrobacter radiotolerans]AHY47016.1 Glycerol dehydrogenase-related enzyme [Rubrobacter radiotolerans]MDX5894422.1 glycerol dehydrogenase [Rubrobacter radiotolerans]SMC05970.1 glycerol 2-dehydrogenase (NAD+) [Rubrobacter radiotolerans DSM 5868]
MSENGRSGPQAMVFAAPGRYVQGRGAVEGLAGELENLGAEKPLVLCDPVAEDVIPSAALEVPGAVRVRFNGECSPGEIDRVAAEARESGADAIVGVGGGKTMDTAKSVAHPAGLPLVIVPTIASTDAPTSAVAVVYEDDGAFKEYRFFAKNPNVVLVDTAIIAGAPVRFLVAGIGDGLSTFFEADTSSKTKKFTMAGGAPLSAALAIARLCYDTLLEHGLAARLAVEKGVVTPAVEKVVEANTLLSGLGFESGGLAAAHSVHNGLTALEGTHHYWHGEKVAFGVLSMLMLEGRPAEVIEEYTDFCLSVGLPVALSDIGLEDVSREDLRKVADLACIEGETIHNEPFDVYPEMVVDAMVAADAFGRDRRSLVEGEASLPAVAQ